MRIHNHHVPSTTNASLEDSKQIKPMPIVRGPEGTQAGYGTTPSTGELGSELHWNHVAAENAASSQSAPSDVDAAFALTQQVQGTILSQPELSLAAQTGKDPQDVAQLIY